MNEYIPTSPYITLHSPTKPYLLYKKKSILKKYNYGKEILSQASQ